jgi:hypothetical protein
LKGNGGRLLHVILGEVDVNVSVVSATLVSADTIVFTLVVVLIVEFSKGKAKATAVAAVDSRVPYFYQLN